MREKVYNKIYASICHKIQISGHLGKHPDGSSTECKIERQNNFCLFFRKTKGNYKEMIKQKQQNVRLEKKLFFFRGNSLSGINNYLCCALIAVNVACAMNSASGDSANRGREKSYMVQPSALTKIIVPRPNWLSSPASKFGAEENNKMLHLYVDDIGKGMKWSMMLPENLDLSKFNYVTMRYRASNIKRNSDYFISLGSNIINKKQEFASLASLNDINPDNMWHTISVPLHKNLTVANMAVQVNCAVAKGEVWIDYILFTKDSPVLNATDMLSCNDGWGESKLQDGSFTTVALDKYAKNISPERLGALGIGNWFHHGKITAQEIPFEIRDAENAAIISTENKTLSVFIGESATEAYMLIAAKLPKFDLTGLNNNKRMYAFDNPERFIVEVEYKDGIIDAIFPVNVKNGMAQILNGFGVYCLTNLRHQVITRISLKNKMDTALFILAGLTLNKATAKTNEIPVAGLPAPVPATAKAVGDASITPSAGGYIIKNNLLEMELQTAQGIEIKSLVNYCLDGAKTSITAGPLFEIGVRGAGKTGKDTLLSSREITIGSPKITGDGRQKTLIVPVDGAQAGVPLKGEIKFTVGEGPDILMNLNLVQSGDKAFTPIIRFPVVRDIRIGSVQDTWYLWTVRGGVINNANCRQGQYTGHNPFQVADVFNPELKGGLALLTYDTRNIMRTWWMEKNNNGVTWNLTYYPQEYRPGENIPIAPTALRAHTGDWRVALKIYKDWLDSWYKPQAPRKDWLLKSFYYQQVTAKNNFCDPKSGWWQTEKLINEYRNFFGCLDYLHIFDFGASEKYGRVGDYNHYELGGLEAMQAGIENIQAMGIRVGLYVEGYLCDDRCKWGKENVVNSALRQKDNSFKLWAHDDVAREYFMCIGDKAWRNHLVSICQEASERLKPNGLYLDQCGHIRDPVSCWSREHGHRIPLSVLEGEQETISTVRNVVKPDIAILTEETPNDFNSQFYDGALSYSIAHADQGLTPSRFDFYRFVIPTFKKFQLVQYYKYNEGAWHLLKFPFLTDRDFGCTEKRRGGIVKMRNSF